MGLFPQVWAPITFHFDHEPVFLVSTFIICISSIGGCFNNTYATRMLVLILNASASYQY